MIPKIIHYCWFGGEIPSIVKQYIEGWKRLCPDYRIMEWNENNSDISECEFARQAYDAKKWAFVSDYVRFFVLNKYGGIYLDTDMELLKNLDTFLDVNGFVGYEVNGVASGIIGCIPGNKIITSVLEIYQALSFIDMGKKMNLKTSPEYLSEELDKIGFLREDKLQELSEMRVYPSSYFYPYSPKDFTMNQTEDTCAIHHYSGSWLDEKAKYQIAVRKKLRGILPYRLAVWIAVTCAMYKYEGVKGVTEGIRAKFKRKKT